MKLPAKLQKFANKNLKALGIKKRVGEEMKPFVPPSAPLMHIDEVLRTPEARFDVVKDFPYAPRYVVSEVHSAPVRIHYVDVGPRDARDTILLMHGEPSWSYLYRFMIPTLVEAGFRCVAPDLVGFGRSDKPSKKTDYSYERQVNWISDFVVKTGLQNVTLFAQDWGGLVGLRVAARYPERFLRICIGNTGIPTGGRAPFFFTLWASIISQELQSWRTVFHYMNPSGREWKEHELLAYEAPFPSEEYKVASRVYPQLVPATDAHDSVEENKGAWKRIFSKWKRPLLTLFSDLDPVSKNGEKIWQAECPGAKGQKHVILKGAGHFIQEDCPEEVCKHLIGFVRDNPMEGEYISRPARAGMKLARL